MSPQRARRETSKSLRSTPRENSSVCKTRATRFEIFLSYFPIVIAFLFFLTAVSFKLPLSQEVSLSGWQLVHKAQETETIYKFHRSLKVAPGGSVTVWSAGKLSLVSIGVAWDVRITKVLTYVRLFRLPFARQWSSSRAALDFGDERATLVCGQWNGYATPQQQRRGKTLSEIVHVLPHLSHPSLGNIMCVVLFFFFFSLSSPP